MLWTQTIWRLCFPPRLPGFQLGVANGRLTRCWQAGERERRGDFFSSLSALGDFSSSKEVFSLASASPGHLSWFWLPCPSAPLGFQYLCPSIRRLGVASCSCVFLSYLPVACWNLSSLITSIANFLNSLCCEYLKQFLCSWLDLDWSTTVWLGKSTCVLVDLCKFEMGLCHLQPRESVLM